VNRSVSDAFYRYKMPRLQAKVEGKGNGIKTVIVNMVEIAKALGRPPTYPTKYFGCELGAQTQFDFKDERFIVNGSHEASKLQDLLDGFIRKFVLCPGCDNPETVLGIESKKNILSQSCKACGYQGVIKGGHRLITYIIKNPPNVNPASQGSSLTKGKREKRRKDGGQNGNGTEENGGDSPRNASDDGEWNASNAKDDFDDDDDWGDVDVSEEARIKRQQELSAGIKSLVFTDDAEKPEKDRMDIFYKFLQRKIDTDGVAKVDEHDKELLTEAERLDVRAKATLILAELLFDQNILQQVKTHRRLLLRFCHENPKAQKYLLGGIEQVIQLHKDQLLPKVALIFKAMYDLDILDEEVLLEWNSKVSKKYVSKELSTEIHAKAAPFMKWLQEAEEEESSEEEDDDENDDDVEIEYDDRARISSLKEQKQEVATIKKDAAGKISNGNAGDAEDDFDIDAI